MYPAKALPLEESAADHFVLVGLRPNPFEKVLDTGQVGQRAHGRHQALQLRSPDSLPRSSSVVHGPMSRRCTSRSPRRAWAATTASACRSSRPDRIAWPAGAKCRARSGASSISGSARMLARMRSNGPLGGSARRRSPRSPRRGPGRYAVDAQHCSVATRTATGSLSAATIRAVGQQLGRRRSPARAEPQPRSSTRRGRRAAAAGDRHQAALRRRVLAGAEGQAGIDLYRDGARPGSGRAHGCRGRRTARRAPAGSGGGGRQPVGLGNGLDGQRRRRATGCGDGSAELAGLGLGSSSSSTRQVCAGSAASPSASKPRRSALSPPAARSARHRRYPGHVEGGAP